MTLALAPEINGDPRCRRSRPDPRATPRPGAGPWSRSAGTGPGESSRRPGHGDGRRRVGRPRNLRGRRARCASLPPVLHSEVGPSMRGEGTSTRLPQRSARHRRTASSPARTDCLGRLAHVGRCRVICGAPAGSWPARCRPRPSDLRMALRPRPDGQGWIALRARRLHRRASALDHAQPSATARRRIRGWPRALLLVEARLLIATGEPDAATRLLAGAPRSRSVRGSGWLSELLTIARAEALLASGKRSGRWPP